MNTALLIYCDEDTLNEIVRPCSRQEFRPAGYTVGNLPGANRIERLRSKLIRETEQYLSDCDSPTWARANAKDAASAA